MARIKLDIGKCKAKTGKSRMHYDVMLLSEDGNILTSISIYKESGMTVVQKKTICKKLKLALDELIAKSI